MKKIKILSHIDLAPRKKYYFWRYAWKIALLLLILIILTQWIYYVITVDTPVFK